ncbi:GNAT family N-acetyltransferase [Variovorax sp. VRV01]|uniref:GNAT family N-acetyltransferase n=1 Tax=Variovorax sp. VRV01 TaxID=2769259 RepID=UPI00177D360B|nr:GNAT family N-acetyltransferase [Variovorax sp. VRV01]MBD9668838.1 GNAT family N-acetyltransferase [Variovorax sp. VRV01]
MEEVIALSSVNIRQFSPLYQSVFNSPPWNDGWSEDAVIERLTGFAAFPTFQGVGLVREGEPLGLVLGWGERWVDGWTFHIKEMCVHQSGQRQGLGKKLMLAFEERLRRLEFLGANLQTGDAAPARIFYEGIGYRALGLVSLHKQLS